MKAEFPGSLLQSSA